MEGGSVCSKSAIQPEAHQIAICTSAQHQKAQGEEGSTFRKKTFARLPHVAESQRFCCLAYFFFRRTFLRCSVSEALERQKRLPNSCST